MGNTTSQIPSGDSPLKVYRDMLDALHTLAAAGAFDPPPLARPGFHGSGRAIDLNAGQMFSRGLYEYQSLLRLNAGIAGPRAFLASGSEA